MKRVISLVVVLLIVSMAACKQEVKKEAPKTEAKVETPKIETTGDASVDTVGKDLGNVDNVEKDLSADQLGDLDSGLADIQNI